MNVYNIHKLNQQKQARDMQLFVSFIFIFFYFEGFISIPKALTANDRNRRIQVYQASDG